MKKEAIVFKKLIWSWIRTLAEMMPHFPSKPEMMPALQELIYDLNQFIALAEQLEMRLSVYPPEPWPQFQWNLDFKVLINQLSRRSDYCLSHLISLFDK